MYIQFHMLINFLQKISMFLHGNINLKAGKYKIWKLYLFHYIWFKSQSSFIFEIWQLKAVGLGHMMCIFLYTHHKSNMAANEFIWFGDSLVHLYHTIPKQTTDCKICQKVSRHTSYERTKCEENVVWNHLHIVKVFWRRFVIVLFHFLCVISPCH